MNTRRQGSVYRTTTNPPKKSVEDTYPADSQKHPTDIDCNTQHAKRVSETLDLLKPHLYEAQRS